MQALCQLEVLGDEWMSQLAEFVADESDTSAVQDYARGLVTGAWARLSDIDERIQSASQHWDVKRMTAVDRNILRMAVQELHAAGAVVPPRVVIDEAIEIAKTFGNVDSPAFINGILDAILKSNAGPAPETTADDTPADSAIQEADLGTL